MDGTDETTIAAIKAIWRTIIHFPLRASPFCFLPCVCIRDTIINASGAPRVGSVDFDVAVGTAIPRGRIHIIPVPETLVQIEPEWRGFLYFIVRDELVIVNPEDMRIVAVVPV